MIGQYSNGDGEGAKHNFWHWQLNRWPKGKARAVHHWTIYFRRID